jgi:predicted metalloendopeptidase
MRWQLIHRAAPYLTKATVDENFDFFAHTGGAGGAASALTALHPDRRPRSG